MRTQKKANYQIASTDQKRYRTFEDLEVYQMARAFRKAMYQVNRKLPSFEKFELGSQIRRAAVSLTNNIAEGHGRFHYLEQIRFCLHARGSLEELLDDLNICEDESYLPIAEISLLKEQGWRVHQVLAGYMRWLRVRKQGAALSLHEGSPAYGSTDDALDEMLCGVIESPASTL
ncbi:MAG: four helix bundle protein [Verrucomicrobia bacterium]|nr:four helix bundle protein [Verrucomicrobiota bacterium]